MMQQRRNWKRQLGTWFGVICMGLALCLLFTNGIPFGNPTRALSLLVLLFAALWLDGFEANRRLKEAHQYELEATEKKHNKERETAKQRGKKSFDRINSMIDELRSPVAVWVLQVARGGETFDCTSLTKTEWHRSLQLREQLKELAMLAHYFECEPEQSERIRTFLLTCPWFLFPELPKDVLANLHITEAERDKVKVIVHSQSVESAAAIDQVDDAAFFPLSSVDE
jgi:hypothetical protein